MNLNRKIFKTKLGEEEIQIEISDLAGQANASVMGHYGDTVVLATVVMGDKDKQSDYFPLAVDYEERFYAAGKILGSRFIRREGRPSDEAVLSGRLIDRTIRPLFDQRIRRDVQVVITVLAYDEKNNPDVIGLLSASTALAISDIPWNGPVAGVQYISEKYEAFFAGPETKISMIELEGKEIGESEASSLFQKAEKEIRTLVDFQKQIVKEIGKKKLEIPLKNPDSETIEKVKSFLEGKIGEAFKNKATDKLKSSLILSLEEGGLDPEKLGNIDYIFENIIDEYVHEEALLKNKRVDERGFDDIRDLYSEIALLKLTHGSGLFIRGATQVLAITTLGSTSAEQLTETMEGTEKKRFMLHYNFPQFSVGEAGRSRGPGRREIGHGALAAKAILAVLPEKEKFPYTIRVVAETLSSNGSSSMASTCATSLSLMDAGVPIKKHVAGIAVGLMLGKKENEYKILTDIQGPEDHYGDMDLKIAGTDEGITAMQMDVKIQGITKKIFEEALFAGKKARTEILKIMGTAIPTPRPEVSQYAPKVLIIKVPVEKIGGVIGSGGKVIQKLIADSLGEISIDIDEDGTTYITGINKELVLRAQKSIEQIIKEFEVGEIISGKIIKILDFGAIMDLGGGRDGMIHVSELKDGFVKSVEDVIHMGDNVTAKVIKVDPSNGKIGLSIKAIKK